MVQIYVIIRPTTAYHAPGKTKKINTDTSRRLEDIIAELKLDKKGQYFYFKGSEIPLNSSLASHNVQDGDVIESCACPKFSVALSAVMRDLDAIDKLPANERTRSVIEPMLDGAIIDPWPDRWQSEEGIKPRTIALATIKKVIQRSDRYADVQVPACQTLEELMDLMKNSVWGTPQRGRNTSFHIVKKQNKDGNPTTCWILLQNKLDKIAALQASTADPIEEFLKADYARHGIAATPRNGRQERRKNATRKRRRLQIEDLPTQKIVAMKCSSCESIAEFVCLDVGCPFHKAVHCTGCFVGNHPILLRDHERVSLKDRRAKVVIRELNTRQYVPAYQSGPFAILSTLYEVSSQTNAATREYSLVESRLKKLAQDRCRSSLYDYQARGRTAFACVESLATKSLVRKELIPGSEEAMFSLLPQAEELGRLCFEFEKIVDHFTETQTMKQAKTKALARVKSNVQLIIDQQEDISYAERLADRCNDAGITTTRETLPTGDYIFSVKRNGERHVLPLVIERKSWSDLADSVNGKGRRRLDCVRVDGNITCAGTCQLCRMKRSGCEKKMFIVEGARCLGRDDDNNCFDGNRCKYCREIMERHGNLHHEILESVLRKLIVNHDCMVQFTRGYNETISSLLMIHEIYSRNQGVLNGVLSYNKFCENTREVRDPIHRPTILKGGVVEVAASDFVTGIYQGKFQDCMQAKISQSNSYKTPCVADVVDLVGVDSSRKRENLRNRTSVPRDDIVVLDSSDTDSHDSVAILEESQNSILVLNEEGWSKTPQKGKATPSPVIDLQSSNDDDDFVEVIEIQPTKRAWRSIGTTNNPDLDFEKPRETSGRGREGAIASSGLILVVTGMLEYDKEFYDDVDKIWKLVFHDFGQSQQDDFRTFSRNWIHQSKFIDNEPKPVSRASILFWSLLCQLRMDLRFYTTRKTNELRMIEHCWNQAASGGLMVTLPAEAVSTTTRRSLRAKRRLEFDDSCITEGGHPSSTSCMICDHAILANEAHKTVCKHVFHKNYLITWMEGTCSRKCPRCRRDGLGLPKKDARDSTDSQLNTPDSSRRRIKATRGRPSRPPPATSTRHAVETAAAIREARLRRFEQSETAHCPRISGTLTQDFSCWGCKFCSYDNSTNSIACGTCGNHRGGDSLTNAAETPSSWQCEKCTLENPLHQECCGACEARNPFHCGLVTTSTSGPGNPVPSTPVLERPSRGADPIVTASGRKHVVCGACRLQGHNRATANPENCPAFYSPNEVELRRSKRREAEEKARAKQDEARRFEEEARANLQASAQREQEIRRLLEAQAFSNETIQKMTEAEAKRKQQAAKRAEQRARRLNR